MIYDVRHETRFQYDAPVQFARCNLRLQPIAWPGQTLESFALDIQPGALIGLTQRCGYPVNVTRMVIDKMVNELSIESRFRITVERDVPTALPDDPTIGEIRVQALANASLTPDAPANYLYPSPQIPLSAEITEWCRQSLAMDCGIIEAGLALAQRIKAEFHYDGEATGTDTSPAEAFAARHGVCQDFAQVMIAGLRGVGLPAAYVSGYLRTIPPPGKARLVGADATHAWVIMWCGAERGWIGFDPTNGCTMGSDHIVAAVGRDYADVAPIDGIFLGQEGQEIEVSVDVEPVV